MAVSGFSSSLGQFPAIVRRISKTCHGRPAKRVPATQLLKQYLRLRPTAESVIFTPDPWSRKGKSLDVMALGARGLALKHAVQ